MRLREEPSACRDAFGVSRKKYSKLSTGAERQRRDDALETDAVQRQQPKHPPPLNSSLVGRWLEVNWKYYSQTDGEPVLMWCSAEVVKVADGFSDKASSRCKKPLQAGAVLLKWPEDKDRDEEREEKEGNKIGEKKSKDDEEESKHNS